MAADNLSSRKIYLYVLIIGVLVLLALSLLASSSLDLMTDDPMATFKNFVSYSHWLSYATIIIFAILLILATWIHFSRGNGMFYLPVLLVLMVFANYNHIFLSSRFFKFKKYHDMWEGGFDLSFLMGIFKSMVGLILVILIYSLIYAFRKKTRKTA